MRKQTILLTYRYSVCFSNALLHVARATKVAITLVPTTAVIGIGVNEAVDTVVGPVQDDCWALFKKGGMLNTGVLSAFFR